MGAVLYLVISSAKIKSVERGRGPGISAYFVTLSFLLLIFNVELLIILRDFLSCYAIVRNVLAGLLP